MHAPSTHQPPHLRCVTCTHTLRAHPTSIAAASRSMRASPCALRCSDDPADQPVLLARVQSSPAESTSLCRNIIHMLVGVCACLPQLGVRAGDADARSKNLRGPRRARSVERTPPGCTKLTGACISITQAHAYGQRLHYQRAARNAARARAGPPRLAAASQCVQYPAATP